MAQSNGANVPKFGSFKPRATQNNRSSDDETKELRKRSNNEHRHRDRAVEKSSMNRKQKRKTRDAVHNRGKVPEQAPAELDEEPENFILDLAGDPKNVEYGCLYRYSIPRYHRAGRGHIIGAPSNVKIDWKQSADKAIVLTAPIRAGGDQRVLSSKGGDIAKTKARDVFIADLDSMEMDEDYLGFKEELSPEDETKSSEPGGGIWNFIKNVDNSPRMTPRTRVGMIEFSSLSSDRFLT